MDTTWSLIAALEIYVSPSRNRLRATSSIISCAPFMMVVWVAELRIGDSAAISRGLGNAFFVVGLRG
jgi:hypothetical protein